MGIYEDRSTILGIRICFKGANGDYFIEYEFTGDTWKENAVIVLPDFLGKSGVIIQTLHPFTTSHNLDTNAREDVGNLWLNNPYFKIQDLLQFK
jgi:hypothetical protein